MKLMQLSFTVLMCSVLTATLVAVDKDKNSGSKSSSSASKSSSSASSSKSDSKKDTISKDKLIGAWELDDNGQLGLKGTTYEFTKDRVTMTFKKVNASGNYALDGDKLHWKLGQGSVVTESRPMNITKLTDKEMVVEIEGGSKATFTKK
jgi:uncharacterized protein (TIGR03066 family)